MPDPTLMLATTPEGDRVLMRVAAMAVIAPGACRTALRQIIGRQLRDTVGSFRKQATPGGSPWEPNPEDYATFKRNVLGQATDQVGVQNGRLRQSMAQDVNEAALEGRVGSNDRNAQSFSDGGPINPLVFIYGRGTWLGFWFGEGQVAPPRRFLPTVEHAEKQADAITERILNYQIHKLGISVQKRGMGALSDIGAGGMLSI